MVYRLILSYRGASYAGWQRQPDTPTVQGTVEQALGELLRRSVKLVGAGRTDAGVHARAQAAHFTIAGDMPLRALVHGSNHLLPQDIRVLAAARMPTGFNARKHASAKLYCYHLVRARVISPLEALFAVQVDSGLDAARMRQALVAVVGRHDFSAFALAGGSHVDPRRRIFAAELVEQESRLTVRLEGEGFLRGMVRSLVGTLLEVGRGRRTVGSFGTLLGGAPRDAAGPTAPAHGLVLERVDYPLEWGPLEEYDARRGESAADPVLD